MRCRGG